MVIKWKRSKYREVRYLRQNSRRVSSKKNQYPVGRLKGITALLTAWAMDKSRMSVQRLPTICMPSGSPSSDLPMGMTTTGLPVRLKTEVNPTLAVKYDIGCSSMTIGCPILQCGNAGPAVTGHSQASHPDKKRSSCEILAVPKRGLFVWISSASIGILVFPMITAPAALIRSTTVASCRGT